LNKKLREHLEGILHQCRTALQSDLKKSQVKEIIEEAKRVISDFRQYRDIVTDDIDRLESHIDLIRKNVALMVESLKNNDEVKRMDKNVPWSFPKETLTPPEEKCLNRERGRSIV
jgi:uncharacterized NAD(P)/FAD-binding protein YdhS